MSDGLTLQKGRLFQTHVQHKKKTLDQAQREDKEWKYQKKDVAGWIVSSERTHRLGSQRCILVIVLSTPDVLPGAKLATETPLTWTEMC